MSGMPHPDWLAVPLTLAAVVGHACVLMATVNFLYGERISRKVLKPVRLTGGLMVVGNPLLLVLLAWPDPFAVVPAALAGEDGTLLQVLVAVLVFYGLVVFPVVTAARLLRRPPAALLEER